MSTWPKSRPRSPRRRYTGPPHRVIEALRQRCGCRCERCGTTFLGPNGGDPHHRTPRGMGGTRDARINRLSNLVALCRPCHDWVESHRSRSIVEGWLVPRHLDPADVPVSSRIHGRVLLADDGSVVSVGGDAA
ncbi:HNH endonuclease [Nocardia farcinica]|uniref:HNH endonuclease n=1 Tax=Nocardia farcinica TaxID=37329 RepID=UPI0034DD5843